MNRFMMSLLVLTACGGAQNATPEASGEADNTAETSEHITAAGLVLVEVDLNGDQRAEVYNYYRDRTQADRLLVRREADLNQDGRIDIWSYYDDSGIVTQEKMDGDFDGNADWVDHYQNGQRTLSEVDSNSDGNFDLFKYYVEGKLVRKERDTTNNGQVDHWELYEDGKLIKAGMDTDGDGNIDVKNER